MSKFRIYATKTDVRSSTGWELDLWRPYSEPFCYEYNHAGDADFAVAYLLRRGGRELFNARCRETGFAVRRLSTTAAYMDRDLFLCIQPTPPLNTIVVAINFGVGPFSEYGGLCRPFVHVDLVDRVPFQAQLFNRRFSEMSERSLEEAHGRTVCMGAALSLIG